MSTYIRVKSPDGQTKLDKNPKYSRVENQEVYDNLGKKIDHISNKYTERYKDKKN
jgi:hypothetical protein